MTELQVNEILCSAYAVKYHGIDYAEGHIVVEQNRTRRRIPDGYYFEDTGTHIYIAGYYADIFQHKARSRKFVVNTVTKEWRVWETVKVTRHRPKKEIPIDSNEISELKK